MDALRASITRLEDWLINDALTLWAARGYDDARGGFYETLDFDGNPVTGQPRRVRVQARQIYTFSKVGMRGWHDGAEALAAKGFDFFLTRACPDNGARGCVHLLSDDGAILDDRRDLYDQAFLLLACSARWAAAKDARALELAEKTLAFMDAELASPHGGWFESDKRELPRRQNPHMHLFEAFMALYDATGEERYLTLINAAYDLFAGNFCGLDGDFVYEYLTEKLYPAGGDLGKTIEPGHMMEWVWLLGRYKRLTSNPVRADVLNIFLKAQHKGTDPKSGFLIDSLIEGDSPKGKPRRLWPQTEYIKASLTLAGQGEEDLRNVAADIIDRLFDTYLNQKTRGLWCDQYDGRGAAIALDVPASILYHLYEAIADAVDFRERMTRS